ncbi:lysophospholipid acyltransferase family protein [Neolewinella lacunae]|uniref:Lysophospholipid acyltransferase family protein n=1 Tax=Neolewinella lacunae TaxID=1517758 RepID=A0A923TAS7_9BACT|nr:lysophospholipid acyltransferase family protein [Neolewinella lacunae]MBC6996789.1 lysophospholipid acyltransferase family protein [Neolewinella lacunae]MDN3637017.1 lysophospholipid acyltransferase family protein [Neolewinella lacunae]
MAQLFYYLMLLPLSRLPLPVLYAVGRAGYWLGYRVLGYRREVVLANLRGSFPAWTEAEVRTQARQFYRYFFDSLAESIKLFSMSVPESIERCRVENPELLAPYAAAGRSVMVVGGHYANWEIAALSFPAIFPDFTVMAIYSPLKNPAMDAMIRKNRERTGLYLVSRREVDEYFAADPVRPAIEIFIADQSPSNHAWEKVHWSHFLERTTSFLAGPERNAVRHNRPVFYMNLRMDSRGHYVSRLIPITDAPREETPGFITEAFVRILEKEIQRDPTPWLWTHRRWKRGVAPAAAEALQGKDYLAAEYEW